MAKRHKVHNYQNSGYYAVRPTHNNESPTIVTLVSSTSTITTTTTKAVTSEIPITSSASPAQATFFLRDPQAGIQIALAYDGDKFEDVDAYLGGISSKGPVFTVDEQGHLIHATPGLPYTGWIAHGDGTGVIFVRPGSTLWDSVPICTCSVDQDTLALSCNCGGATIFAKDLEDFPFGPFLYILHSVGGSLRPLSLSAIAADPVPSGLI
ncbi:hypothetical protein G7054_g5831 [Neopestalotiopsis clavispora]|nr:hypothetical protein G7054_g5831 [Neopestalotiopsis clavispora]